MIGGIKSRVSMINADLPINRLKEGVTAVTYLFTGSGVVEKQMIG